MITYGQYFTAWEEMWLMAILIFFAFKILMVRQAQKAGHAPNWRRLCGFFFLWPGMDAKAFFQRESVNPPPSIQAWLAAIVKTIFGIVVLWGLAQEFKPDLLAGWIGMTGLIFFLHFGTFHLLALVWQQLGLNAQPLMHWPVLATSLSEFWSQRWNTAFRDLAFSLLYVSLARRLVLNWALLGTFLFSGLVHDLVISIPARAGYGGPTLYFLIQGLGILAERSPWARLHLRRTWRGRLFAFAVILLPLALLFHPTFVRRVMIPFFQHIHALP